MARYNPYTKKWEEDEELIYNPNTKKWESSITESKKKQGESISSSGMYGVETPVTAYDPYSKKKTIEKTTEKKTEKNKGTTTPTTQKPIVDKTEIRRQAEKTIMEKYGTLEEFRQKNKSKSSVPSNIQIAEVANQKAYEALIYEEMKRLESGSRFYGLTNEVYQEYLDNFSQNAKEKKQTEWIEKQYKNLEILKDAKIRSAVEEVVDKTSSERLERKIHSLSQELGMSYEQTASLCDTVKREKTAQREQTLTEGAENLMSKGPAGKVLAHGLSIGANVESGLVGLVGMAEDAANKASGEYKPIDTKADAAGAFRDHVRGEIESSIVGEEGEEAPWWRKGLGMLYQAGSSSMDSLGQAVLFGPAAAGILMGGQAAGSTKKEVFERTGDYDKALLTGVASGTIETFTERMGLDRLWDIIQNSGKAAGRKFLVNMLAQSGIEGIEEFSSEALNSLADWLINRSDSLVAQSAKEYEKNGATEKEAWNQAINDVWKQALKSGLVGAMSGAMGAGVGSTMSTKMSENEQRVVDNEVEGRVKEKEKRKGKKLSLKEKTEIREQVEEDLRKGLISVESIERTLGGEHYSAYESLVKESEEFNKLYKTESGKLSREQQRRLDELETKNGEKKYSDRLIESQSALSKSVVESIEGDMYLQESYAEKGRRSQTFQADVSKYDAKQQETIQKAIDSGILNDTRRTHEFVDLLARISADKGVSFDFADNERLKASGFAIEGKTVNGVRNGNGITININSAKALNSVVGHEITHVLEGTEHYEALQQAVFEYARSKGEYDSRLEKLTELYKDVKDADVNQELTADLVGDYLFTDEAFIRQLSAKNRNVFQRLFDEIKYMCKIATAGSKEARQLEKVKKTFEKAYRETSETSIEGKEYDIQEVSLSEPTEIEVNDQKYILKDSDAVSYATISKIGTIKGSVVQEQYSKDNDYDLDERINTAIESCDIIADENGYVKMESYPYTIRVTKSGLRHGLIGKQLSKKRQRKLGKTHTRKDIHYNNANICDSFGDIIKNSVVVNELADRDGGLVLMGYATSEEGQYVVRTLVKKVGDTYSVESWDSSLNLKAVNTKKIEMRRADIYPYEQEQSSTSDISNISIEEFLQIVNDVSPEFADTLSEDVLKHLGNERSENPSLNVKYSLSETDNENNTDAKTAEEYFGTTYKISEAGYLLTDGKLLDLSGRHEGGLGGYRTVDHRDVADAFDEDYGDDTYTGGMLRFMNSGNIRLSPESGGINLCVKPNKKQLDVLDRFISHFRGEVILDIDDGNGNTVASIEYPVRTYSKRIINDINAYFDEGIMPEQPSSLGQFRYSLSEQTATDSNGVALTKEPVSPVQLSVSDSRYSRLAENPTKNEKKLRRMVEREARRHGFTERVMHGTEKFGFTVADASKSDDGISFFATNDVDTVESYSGVRETSPITSNENIGNYDLYANTDGLFVIDCKDAGWDSIETDAIPLEEKLQYIDKKDGGYWSTRTISKWAKDNGYRGVLFKNVIDYGGIKQEFHSSDVYNFFYPQEQVKSADLVTYDADGKVIPLSQRFNAENDDMRYSISDDSQIAPEPPIGAWQVRGEDIALKTTSDEDIAPMSTKKEEVAPVQQDDISSFIEPYNEHQKNNWKNSKKIVLYESREQFKSFVEDAKERKNAGKKLYFGKVKAAIVERVRTELGYDIEGYNCALYSDNVRKIFKDHGDEKKENERGQRAIITEDFFMIPEVIGTPDAIEPAGEYKGQPVVHFKKNGMTIVGVITEGALDLYPQTMYASKKNRSLATVIDEQAPIYTPETTRSTASIDSIPQISENATENFGEDFPIADEYKETPSEEKKFVRKEYHKGIIDTIKAKFAEAGFDFDTVLKEAKDKSTWASVDNTPQRFIEKTLGYKAGQILNDLTVNQTAQNESKAIRWLNSFTDRKTGFLAQISKQYGINPGSKESAAAQMYGEGFYVNEAGDYVAYTDAELAKDFPDPVKQQNIKALAKDPRIRQVYDETLDLINESRRRNGYPEIPRRKDYFLHFHIMEDAFSRLGIPFNPNDIKAKDLPTDINGVTADLKPGQPYFASSMRRKGNRTTYDLLGGLERYLGSAKNQIYHIDDIQTLRAVRNYIADTYGQANGLENLDDMSEEEAQHRIEQVYRSHLSTFAKFLNEQANHLAGKTALIDRGLEGIIGRRGITFLDNVNKQVGSNMVGWNVSSSMTNLVPMVQAFAKTNKFAFVKGFTQTVANRINSISGRTFDDFTEQNPLIVRRKGAEKFARTPWEVIKDSGYILASAVDDFSTEVIVRAKYNELINKGMDSHKAHIEADKWSARLLGDRSYGQQPHFYNSKMFGLVTKFQLEVRNQLDSMFYDTIQEEKISNEAIQNGLARNSRIAAKVTSTFVQLALGQHIFGQIFEKIAGYNPAIDIIEVLVALFGWDDEEESEDTALDNMEQAFLMLLEDLPYTSTFTGGRIPISSALPIKEVVTGKDQYGNDKSRLKTIGEALPYYVLPTGYGQGKKTWKGIEMYDKDLPIAGSYTDSGKLRFTADESALGVAQAAVFGQYSGKTAREYFEREQSPLSAKKTQELIDLDIPISEYWDIQEKLKGKDKLGEKADVIADLDIPIAKKNLLINNAANRKEAIDLTDYDLYADFEEFDFAQKNPGKYQVAKMVGGYNKYVTYMDALGDIKADQNKLGQDISGSRKRKVFQYINGLSISNKEKAVLIKSQYPSETRYNGLVVKYINQSGLNYEDKQALLEELGITATRR